MHATGRGGHLSETYVWGGVEGWTEQSGRAKRKHVGGGDRRPWELQDAPQDWAPRQKEKRLHAAAGQPGTQPQNLLRDLKAVDSGWSACSGHRGPTGSMGDEKEGGEKITWWEKKGCIAYTIPASASQCFPRALHVVARFGK